MRSWLLCAELLLPETSVRYGAELVLATRESSCRVERVVPPRLICEAGGQGLHY